MIDFLDAKQVAALLGIHRVTLYRWRREHKGPPCYLIGGRHRYLKPEIETWLKEQKA